MNDRLRFFAPGVQMLIRSSATHSVDERRSKTRLSDWRSSTSWRGGLSSVARRTRSRRTLEGWTTVRPAVRVRAGIEDAMKGRQPDRRHARQAGTRRDRRPTPLSAPV
jgi:hypothetical protein